MNDFELRRELRELRRPCDPRHDLWPQIARQIAQSSVPAIVPIHRRRWPLALAAGLAMTVAAGVFFLAIKDRGERTASNEATPRARQEVGEQIQRARELAAFGDPRLAGAEVVLDSANQELDSALQQHPDAVFLVGLINRTHAQQRKLARLGLDAS